MTQPTDLPTELLRERDRVRDVVKPAYEEIGQAGQITLRLFINPALQRADKALKEHDALLMLEALAALRGLDT